MTGVFCSLRCHLPTMNVWYPAGLSTSASVTQRSFSGVAKTGTPT